MSSSIRVSLFLCVLVVTMATACADSAVPENDVNGSADAVEVEDATMELPPADNGGTDNVTDEGGSGAVTLETTAGISLAGEFNDEWGTFHKITSSIWIQSSEYGKSVFEIQAYDNDEHWVVAKNSDENDFSAGKFSRFDWTISEGTIYFCNTCFDADSLQDAMNVAAADPDNPSVTGCGTFAWTVMNEPVMPDIRGTYDDIWETRHLINEAEWIQDYMGDVSTYEIESFDNESGTIIAHNSEANAFSGGLWSRMDWIRKDEQLYFCHTRFDAASAQEASEAEAPDSSDPATAGCAGFAWTPMSTTALYMDQIVDAPGHTGEGFSDSNNAVNDVRGAGRSSGSADVFSLGTDFDENGYLVAEFSEFVVTDGPGTDFVVFENAFEYSADQLFLDPTIVSVSRDGLTWVHFPFDYLATDETDYSCSPEDWTGFAGISPCLFNADSNVVDPFDRELAGGDHFDLSDLPGDDPEAAAIMKFGFRYLRLIPAMIVINPDTGEPFVSDPISNGSDIDGIYGRYLVLSPE